MVNNSEPPALLKGFEKWQPLPQETEYKALEKGLIVFDTNILLNLYVLEREGLDEWRRLFEKIKDRIWVPHQVMDEFWKNRFTKTPNSSSTKGIRGKLENARGSMEAALQEWLFEKRGKDDEARERVDNFSQELDETLKKILDGLTESQEQVDQRFTWQPENDHIVNLLNEFLAERVGEGFTEKELLEEHAKADERYEKKIPPGFEDDGSSQESSKGKDSDAKYGDYLAWRQILNHAEGEDKEDNWVVFVTNDLSVDWWRYPYIDSPNKEKKTAYREYGLPHPGLVAEAKNHGIRYAQFNSGDFLQRASSLWELGLKESAFETTDDAEGPVPTSTVQDELDELDIDSLTGIKFFLTRHREILATAHTDDRGKATTVLAGSSAKKGLSASTSDSVRNERTRLLGKGVLEDSSDDSRYLFVKDYTFSSSSTAASVVAGGNRSGNLAWKTRMGQNAPTLGDVREYLNQEDEEDDDE